MEAQITGSLAMTLRLTRLFGLAPLNFTRSKDGWVISPSQGWHMYGFLVLAYLNVLLVLTLIGDNNTEAEKNSVINFLWFLNRGLMVTAFNFAILGARRRMGHLISYLNSLQQIQREIDVNPKYLDKKVLLLVLWLPLVTATTIMDNLLNIIIDDAHTTNILYMGCKALILMSWYNMVKLIEIQIIMLIIHVLKTFESINMIMNQMIEGSFPSPAPMYYKTVRRLSSAYVSTCGIVRDLNSTIGFLMFLLLALNTLTVIISPYIHIQLLQKQDQVDYSIAYTVYIVISYSRHFGGFVLLIEPCHWTHSEMEYTEELVSRLMHSAYSIYEPLAVELDIFRMYLTLNQVSYSPLRIVTMSRSLIITVTANAITYLVILFKL